MVNREWHFRDKSGYGDGPWMQEPDKVQWTDESTGLPCLIVRSRGGALCGYVGVAQNHPFYGQGYNDVPEESAHGGLTFSGKCTGDEHGICHVVESGENDNVWWLGFDCAHCYDYSPAHAKSLESQGLYKMPDEVYRDIQYVKNCVTKLAAEIKSAERSDA
jgi:hypothetical protein